MRLSQLSPAVRDSHPMPPPRVSPPTPVWLMTPPGVASPCIWVAPSRSAHVVPPPQRARRASASTTTARMALRSIIRPPSHTPWPAKLCPPPRTAISRPSARPKATAAATSSTVVALRDGGRTPVDVAVPQRPGGVVPAVAGVQDGSGEALAKGVHAHDAILLVLVPGAALPARRTGVASGRPTFVRRRPGCQIIGGQGQAGVKVKESITTWPPTPWTGAWPPLSQKFMSASSPPAGGRLAPVYVHDAGVAPGAENDSDVAVHRNDKVVGRVALSVMRRRLPACAKGWTTNWALVGSEALPQRDASMSISRW